MTTNTPNPRQTWRKVLGTTLLIAALLPPAALAQAASPAKKNSQGDSAQVRVTPQHETAPANAAPLDEEALGRLRRDFFELLRPTPRLTEVLRYDPALLGDQQYIASRNPQLAQFLTQHPEVARNPEFYLFSRAGGESLQEVEWNRESERERVYNRMINDIGPFLIFLIIFGGFIWLLQFMLAQLRWKRTFNTQTEIYNKLLDRFSSNEDMLAYVRSESGKRFLEAATLPLHGEAGARGAISPLRMLLPLQAGSVLTLLGFGLFYLHGRFGDNGDLFLVLSILALAIGIGFIISAVLGFVMARRFGLLPAGFGEKEVNEKSLSSTAL